MDSANRQSLIGVVGKFSLLSNGVPITPGANPKKNFLGKNLLTLFVSQTVSLLCTIFSFALKWSSLQKVSKFNPKYLHRIGYKLHHIIKC
jgi:hypothetical protein